MWPNIYNNLLQSVTGVTNCNKRLSQSVTGIAKSDNYDEVILNNFWYSWFN